MAINAVSTAASTATTGTGSTKSASTAGTGTSKSTFGAAAGLGKDDFMQLLIAQLRNQDPMKPMEDKEFISQLAQFSSLEAVEKLNEQMEELTNANMIVQAATLLGKQVTAKLQGGETVTGTVSQVKIVDSRPVAVVNGTEIETSLITVIGAGGAGGAGTTPASTSTSTSTSAPTAASQPLPTAGPAPATTPTATGAR